MDSKTQVIIPVKKLEDSKTSFSDILTEGERGELTLAMLEDILRAVQSVEGVESLVVTPDEEVMSFVERLGNDYMEEPGVGLIRALNLAIGESIDSGFQEVLILPSDVPMVRPEDIENILEKASGERSVVITPSEENGTNALLLRPPDVMDLQYGGESFPEHVKEARSRDIDFQIYRSENLERDIDAPPHLLKVETRSKGTKTHSFLDTLKDEI